MSSATSLTIDLSKMSLSSPGRSAESLLSPPGSPARPKRNPLRVKSDISLKQTSQRAAASEIVALGSQVSKLHDRMYEIQELRHSSSAPTERLNSLLSTLAEQISILTPRIDAVQAPELRKEWDKLLEKQKMLLEEMKEDGWLIRFRTTADQAEAMMDHLQKSQTNLSTYLDRISSTSFEIPQNAGAGLSMTELTKINKAHETMKSTYMPSVSKILKVMNRSITERATKNGEALRRYGDMESRWTGLQRSLAQLDAGVRVAMSQYGLDEGDVEVLEDSPESRKRSPTLTLSSPTISMRRIPSSTSISSIDKPRWNVSTKVNTPPRSFGYTGNRAPSPTGSTSSSRNFSNSRIPISTPRRQAADPNTPSPLSTPAHPSMYRPNTLQPMRTYSRASAAPLAPATAPRPRPSRAPPSSFRAASPSPFISRPSSRMSMSGSVSGHRAGVASSVRGPIQELKPFQPSKYDQLDQVVAGIIAEEGFDLFVARIDPPLGRGQRRAEGEEWKGTYVFGAGEKQSSVKLLTLAGDKLGGQRGQSRTKCLVRVQGMWVGLAEVLRERKSRQDVF